MLTLALNAAIVMCSVLLLLGPGLAVALRRGLTAGMLAGTTALTLVGVCFVAYVTALAGYGTLIPLRVCAAILVLVLIWDAVTAVRQVRRGSQFRPGSPDALVIPVGLLVAIWLLTQPLLALGRLGERFGLASIGNGDLPSYVLAANNVAAAGFRDDQHLAGVDLGAFAHHASYMGPTSLINFLSASTGLGAWKVAMASIGVAIFLSVVGLWALVKAVWPSSRNSAAGAVVVASFASLSSYLVAQYFLGGVLALASVTTSLAGAVTLARADRASRMSGALMIAGGGALGVYSYGHLGLPVVILLPMLSVVLLTLRRERTLPLVLTVARLSGLSVLAALALSAVAVPTAISLVRAQSSVTAGWTIPAMRADTMLFWASDVRQPSSAGALTSTWLLLGVLFIFGLVCAGRRGFRDSAITASAIASGCLVVAFGCVAVYGASRYQTWKMESFLLPFALAVCMPALSSIRIGRNRLGVGLVLMGVGAAALSPILNWQYAVKVQAAPGTAAAANMLTQPGLLALQGSPELKQLSSVNIRMGSFFETMASGAIIPTSVVILSSDSYYIPRTNVSTCTLTRLDMLSPGETAYTDLGGGYVLLQRPSVCAVKK